MNVLKKIQDATANGTVYTLKRFTKFVKDGDITGYDGFGEFHDGEKATGIPVKLNMSALRKATYPYVIWYNK